jgi:acyl dehydratase
MATQARSTDFERIQVGDQLPTVVKLETQETINDYWRLAQDRRRGWHSLHTDEEYARTTIFGGTVNMGTATVAYICEVLQEAFLVENILRRGSRLEMRATEPIRAGDTVTFTGRVTGKRVEGGQRLVDCELTGTNQFGQTVAIARATIAF